MQNYVVDNFCNLIDPLVDRGGIILHFRRIDPHFACGSNRGSYNKVNSRKKCCLRNKRQLLHKNPFYFQVRDFSDLLFVKQNQNLAFKSTISAANSSSLPAK